ncbi:MAG: DUF2797 domain-containing protein [Proteobacteria bacterium]|nr:DUF2797 domain-containing protein [Pseudomonadota bacterium]
MSSEVPTGGCSADNPVQYALRIGDEAIPLNPHIGASISLTWTGNIACIHCDRPTKKSFSQGYCYPCFKKLAQCDLCVVSPERCHFEKGTCRDEEFAENFCMRPHIVYLANSSGIKVGITRQENLPTRWIDQGAVQAVPILTVQTRQQSGFVEEAFKNLVADKTHWQKMLKSEDQHIDLEAAREQLMADVKPHLDPVIQRFGIQAIQPLTDADVQTFVFPVAQYPEKVTSLSFDKTGTVSGKLQGIKGQYLILDSGVINLRRFTSYEISFTADGAAADAPANQLSLL